MNDPFPDEIDEALWDEACRRANAIRGFLKRRSGRATTTDVTELAADVGVSQATAYRLLKLFRAGGTALSLADRKRGRPEGHRTLDERREEIIRAKMSALVWSIWTTSKGRETSNDPGTAVVAVTILFSPRRLARLCRSMSSRRAMIVRRCGGCNPADTQFVRTSRTSCDIVGRFRFR